MDKAGGRKGKSKKYPLCPSLRSGLRPDEGDPTDGLAELTEGETTHQLVYDRALETRLLLTRTFGPAGIDYFEVQLTARNEIVPEDSATINWRVVCQQPVDGALWTLDYPSAIAVGDMFVVTLRIPEAEPFPTRCVDTR